MIISAFSYMLFTLFNMIIFYRYELILFFNSSFGQTPIILSTKLPFLNTKSVGMLIILYLKEVAGFSSTLTLPNTTFPPISFAKSSITGVIIRQGPHHAAQQSTIIILYFFIVSSKSSSFILNGVSFKFFSISYSPLFLKRLNFSFSCHFVYFLLII